MRKSNKLFKTHHALLYIMPILSLFFLFRNTSALDYGSNTNIQFTFNPTLSIDLSSSDLVIPNLSPGSYADSNIITINVATNNVTGYTLTATVGNSSNPHHNTTNLTNISNSNYQFTSLSSPVSTLDTLSNNTWGYNYSNDNGTTWHNYTALPLYSDTSSPSATLSSPTIASNDSIKFKIGAKADSNLPAGTYTNTINFYATTNLAPITFYDAFASAGKTKTNSGYYILQDMTPAICNAVESIGSNSQAELLDVRDNQIYSIAKLLDNHCWMQNLNLGAVALTQSLTSSNTNLSDDPTSTIAAAVFNGWRKNVGTTNYTGAELIPIVDDNNTDNTSYGTLYNYCAASAGTICTELNDINASYDLCPTGWRLPIGGPDGEFQNLYDINEYNTEGKIGTPISSGGAGFTYAGTFVNSGPVAQGIGGRYWSSMHASSLTAMYSFTFDTNSVSPANNNSRYIGGSIRCVAK